jgi:tetratricopeptide (TPR) repeat protein
MYLRGNKWNMTRRTRRHFNPWRVVFLLFFVGSFFYINQFVVPNTPGFSPPTPTPTRSPESFVNEAEAYFTGGKIHQAIQSYQQAVHADPHNKSNYVTLARLQIWAGQYEEALENAEFALIGNESYSMGHAVRAWALNYLKEELSAEAAVKKALDLDPNNALAHAYYAEILTNQGSYPKAGEHSRTSLDLAPNLLEALRARGYVLYFTGNYQESIDFYRAALEMNKHIQDLYMYLGYNYKALREYDQAVDMFQQADFQNPSNPIPDVEIASIYAELGSHAKAVQYAEIAVKDDPENPRWYGVLGTTLYRNGEFNAAIAAFSLAIHGGVTEDETTVKGLPFDRSRAISNYYQLYGFSLIKVTPPRCSEAVPIFQALINGVPDDQVAVDNATYGLDICAQAVGE